MPIRLLPSEVASQIAAGEVVERPASVVKELLENALDAGATTVNISVEGGGQKLVEVADNGFGIPADEIALSVERHATSKLVNADDLFRISTLGFRGEALASIGSVANLTITSRTPGAEIGVNLRVEGGINKGKQLIGAPTGTVVRVEDLFFNVPARKKFLKSERTERRVIDELVTRYAMAYPHVRMKLVQEGRISLHTSGNGERREVLAALYGAEIARQMLEVMSADKDLDIQGFISPPAVTRSNRREIIFFVNGRPVQDVSLVTALIKAYHTLLMVGRYPMATLFLEIPADQVDVNVHPTKAEVRFREADRIFSGVHRAVRKALLAHTPVPGLESQLRWTPEPASQFSSPQTSLDWELSDNPREQKFQVNLGVDNTFTGADDRTAPTQVTSADGRPQAEMDSMRTPLLRLVGQIANTFIVAEGPDGLYLIDQHAAHERVLFEKFLEQRHDMDEGKVPAQTLLQPATVNLPPASARMISEQLAFLGELGFTVEEFGINTFLVRSIPVLLAKSEPTAALRVLVEEFEEDETPLLKETEARLIARICKRAAVKAGMPLTSEEQSSLLHDLESCQQPRTCPHGRPTMIHLSVDLLERQFGRRGPR
jgi:DNA mismatch repair protein MutL